MYVEIARTDTRNITILLKKQLTEDVITGPLGSDILQTFCLVASALGSAHLRPHSTEIAFPFRFLLHWAEMSVSLSQVYLLLSPYTEDHAVQGRPVSRLEGCFPCFVFRFITSMEYRT